MSQGDPQQPPPSQQPPESMQPPTKDECTMGMLVHLLAIFTGFIGPLIIWLIKKDESKFVDDQGKESLNFIITMIIAHLVAGVLWCAFIGIFITFVLIPVQLVFNILAGVAANKGEWYRYPVCLRLIT